MSKYKPRGRPFTKGHTVSKETRRAVSLALKGKKFTEEHKQKISAANKGRIAVNKGMHKHPEGYWRDYFAKWKKENNRKWRKLLIEQMGGKCCQCGFSDIRALQIDHINGGGHKERDNAHHYGNGSFWKKVLESVMNNEGKYQLLCANCNWIKKYTNNEVPGLVV